MTLMVFTSGVLQDRRAAAMAVIIAVFFMVICFVLLSE
jgi:hypothetical protein